jgi:hypothetical protein
LSTNVLKREFSLWKGKHVPTIEHERRLAALEESRANGDYAQPALVQVINEHGPTPEQEAARTAAAANGIEVVTITFKDCRSSK